MRIVKKIVKNIFRSAGLNVSQIVGPPPSPPPSPLVHYKIELLLDVGANIGQFAMHARAEGYKGRIVSFEPVPDAYETLLLKSQSDPLWTVHKRCAVGSKPGEAEINISGNSQSSSLLPMLQAHLSAAPDSVYIGKAKTEVITLDSVFESYRTHNEKTLLKIDAQGFETEVLNGLSKNFQHIFAVQIELATVPLYGSQDLYQHFFTFFEESGFFLWSLIPVFGDASTGQLLEFDAVFVRKH
jgi:FkbM family methyltransferase